LDNNEREQFSILYRPSIDSVEEVKIDTNAYPAEEGRAGGAVINLITKSGTNTFHGGVYEYFRNTARMRWRSPAIHQWRPWSSPSRTYRTGVRNLCAW
jgi:hypothetical protein